MTPNEDYWQDRAVFVTGATGLVGSWVVKALLSQGANVTTLIRDWIPTCELVQSGALSKANVVRGDIRDLDLMDRILIEHEIKTVIHLAAQTIVGIANRSPISTFETNVQGTWNLLEAARRIGSVDQLVIASTDKAYGVQEVLPYDEETPLQGTHPYDVSKSCADLIAQAYFHTYALPVVITRCGNFYGGGDLNWNRIVPGTIRSVLRGQAPVIRSDGLFVRDYFYVEDGAYSYLHLAESLIKQPELAGEAFNFSNEQPVTVLELVELILELMDAKSLTPVILNHAANEIPKQFLSSQKARRLLQWSPEYDLSTGLRRTIAWYEAYFEKHAEAMND